MKLPGQVLDGELLLVAEGLQASPPPIALHWGGQILTLS